MLYRLVPASPDDKEWLDDLRREVYQDLFQATFGGWDEARHARQFAECWQQGGIHIVEVKNSRVGMIQSSDRHDAVWVAEIQIEASSQNKGLGTQILTDTIARAHAEGKEVSLRVGLKNERALRLYQRLGFMTVARDDTHTHMTFRTKTRLP
jgi:ribosomal protein S18 acetylase RimI-like enzyme